MTTVSANAFSRISDRMLIQTSPSILDGSIPLNSRRR
jgi:hypothetical protein